MTVKWYGVRKLTNDYEGPHNSQEEVESRIMKYWYEKYSRLSEDEFLKGWMIFPQVN